MSTDGGMDKENVALYIQWNIIRPLKKEILPFATTWMDLEGVMLSEISQRKTNTIWFHLHAESKTKTKPYQTHRYRKWIGGCQRQGVEGGWNGRRGPGHLHRSVLLSSFWLTPLDLHISVYPPPKKPSLFFLIKGFYINSHNCLLLTYLPESKRKRKIC